MDDNLKKQAELMSVIDKETTAYKHAFGYTEWRSACEVWSFLCSCICHDLTCLVSEVCLTYLTGRIHSAECLRSALTSVCGASRQEVQRNMAACMVVCANMSTQLSALRTQTCVRL